VYHRNQIFQRPFFIPSRWFFVSSYNIAPKSGCIVVQSGGEIMKKALLAGETLKMQTACLVAFDSSCRAMSMPYTKVTDSILINRGFDLQIEGPGTVYFSASTTKRNRSSEYLNGHARNRHSSTFQVFRFVNVLLFSIAIFALSRFIEIEVIEHGRGQDFLNRHQPQQQLNAGGDGGLDNGEALERAGPGAPFR